ncbi:MAG: hypothetical protein FJZ01_28655, partial [Candidatus Sericytochromatia bacterium]|nr:hypothetical protein [Candidatus Tanganyikabacteria bacterium]
MAPDPGKLVLDASKMNAGDSWKSEDRKRAEGKYLAEQALEVKAMRAFFGRLSAKGVAGTGTYQAQFSEGQRRLVASVGSGRTEERAARQAEHDEKRSIAREQVIEDDFEAFQVRHDLAADQAYPSEFLEGPASLAPGGRQAAGKPGASAEGGAGSRPAGEAGAKPGTGAPAVPGTGGGAAVPGTGGRVAVPGTGGGAA